MSFNYNGIIIKNRLDVNTNGHVITNGKGQLITDNGAKSIAQAAGLDNQVLTADSSQSSGLIWKTPTAASIGLLEGNGIGFTVDVPNNTTTISVNELPLDNASSISGILPIVNGGTGASIFTEYNKLVMTNSDSSALMSSLIDPNEIPLLTTKTGTTTDATPTAIYSFATTNDTAYAINATFIGKQTLTPFDTAMFKVSAAFNNIAGTLTLVGGANDVVYIPATTTWNAAIVVSGADIVYQITGAASTSVGWKVVIDPIITI